MHINWEKPNLNQQVHHVNLTLTVWALYSFTLCNSLKYGDYRMDDGIVTAAWCRYTRGTSGFRRNENIEPLYNDVMSRKRFRQRKQSFSLVCSLRASSQEPGWPGWLAYRDQFHLGFLWEISARFPRWEKAEDELWRKIRETKQTRWNTKL